MSRCAWQDEKEVEQDEADAAEVERFLNLLADGHDLPPDPRTVSHTCMPARESCAATFTRALPVGAVLRRHTVVLGGESATETPLCETSESCTCHVSCSRQIAAGCSPVLSAVGSRVALMQSMRGQLLALDRTWHILCEHHAFARCSHLHASAARLVCRRACPRSLLRSSWLAWPR